MGRISYDKKGVVSYETLYQIYVVESLSVKAASNRLGVSPGTIHKYLKLYQIPRRSRGNRLSRAAAHDVPPTVQTQTKEEDKGEYYG